MSEKVKPKSIYREEFREVEIATQKDTNRNSGVKP